MTATMKHSKLSLLCGVVSFTLCFSEAGVCNQYKDLGLDKKVENSDLVLVVKVVSVSPKDCIAMYVCGSVDVDLLALHKG